METRQAELPQEIIERITRKRGRMHVFPGIEPRKTALLVVDMQNGFIEPGAAAAIPQAGGIIPNINRLARSLRAAGGRVVFLQHLVDAEALRDWSNYYEHFMHPEVAKALVQTFGTGCHGFELHADIEVDGADLKVPKRRFGAFVPGSSELHQRLQGLSIDTLIISGTVTNVCCEATARDAAMLNYRVFFLSDGTAALTEAEHRATLSDMACMFADVRSTRDVIDLIEKGDGTPR